MGKTINLPSNSKIIEQLEKAKKKFTITFTNTTTLVKYGQTTYCISDKHLSLSDLGFIGQVKRYAEKSPIPQQSKTSKDVNYYRWGHVPEGITSDIIEIDVNQAYWHIALQKGYIDQKIYEKGLTIDKMTRLIALGSLATKKRVFKFDGEKHKYIGDLCNERTRSYFFDVAHDLGMKMNACFEENKQDIYFFWVDAFFCRKACKYKVIKKMNELNLQVKIKDISTMYVRKGGRNEHTKVILTEINGTEPDRTNIKIKPFQMITNNQLEKKFMIDNFKKTLKNLPKTP